jgi:hypothetical protein
MNHVTFSMWSIFSHYSDISFYLHDSPTGPCWLSTSFVTSSTDSRRHIFDWFSILFKLDVCCILFLFFYPTTSRIMGSCQDSCFNNQSAKSLLNILASKPSTNLELLSDWSIDLNVLRMFGRWNMNERSHKVTPNRILLDVSVSRKI